MTYEGILSRMHTEFGKPIQYNLMLGDRLLNMNQLLNKEIEINFLGYQCMNCDRKKKIFRQGFCYDCFYSSPAVGDWIMKPELSTAHLDISDRDLTYEKKVQLQPHIVYLALSSEVKVGVTTKNQVPIRWIDQGATRAIAIVEVPNRYLAGITEVALKKYYTDKTNWRKMLKNDISSIDLMQERAKLKYFLPQEVQSYFDLEQHEIFEMHFPVMVYPNKVTSLKLERSLRYSGKLMGIKGQYLIFEDGTVFNVRSSEGYLVRLDF